MAKVKSSQDPTTAPVSSTPGRSRTGRGRSRSGAVSSAEGASATPRARRTRASRTAAAVEPTQEAIAQRAYEIYTRRGGTHGADLDDWLEAERQLREELAK